jgi:UDP-N-acetyl-D-mannosaminuronate dehydrogenase|tara:strand:+ start:497 stop:865 length:369 start_codon:yes stop_codon:yes gene_type:complete
MNLDKNLKIAVIGLGYVGLPLAIEFSKKYSTIGFDKDEDRINQLKDGIDKTLETCKEDLDKTDITYTTKLNEISDCNANGRCPESFAGIKESTEKLDYIPKVTIDKGIPKFINCYKSYNILK